MSIFKKYKNSEIKKSEVLASGIHPNKLRSEMKRLFSGEKFVCTEFGPKLEDDKDFWTSVFDFFVDNAGPKTIDYYRIKPAVFLRIFKSFGLQKTKEQTNLSREKTMQERFGAKNPMHSKVLVAKMEETNLRKFGKKNPLACKEIQEKVKETNLERYGFENAKKSQGVKEKSLNTWQKNNFTSTGEREVRDWLESLGFRTRKSHIGGSKPLELDIRVSDKNDKPLMYIEYNGDYFHSEARSGSMSYHKTKSDLCYEQKGRHLLHIFDSEWKNHKGKFKEFIKSKLIPSPNKIFARKCEVREVPKKEAFLFCENNHLQGKPYGVKLLLGLYFKEELVSLMTFSKNHRQGGNQKTLQMSRYCIKNDWQIVGGLSKLSKNAFKIIGEFTTFVHLRLSSGASYLNNEYKDISSRHNLRPDYWYWDIKKNKVVSKQSRQKKIVNTPPGMTEREHAIQEGLFRVWDCGKLKLSYQG